MTIFSAVDMYAYLQLKAFDSFGIHIFSYILHTSSLSMVGVTGGPYLASSRFVSVIDVTFMSVDLGMIC